jgi:putative Mn2+ efflux pump MntP
MLIVLKMAALILSLGIDTLIMSISLGFFGIRGKTRIAGAFASTEALMAVIGLITGQGLGQVIGNWASLTGGIVLLAVSAWFLFFDHDDDEERKEKDLVGWTLILTALSVSLDELAVGFSIGLVGVPVTLTIILIACQAFIFTLIGITFGARLKPYLGEWSEKLAGTVLGLLGVWLAVSAVVHLLR